MSNSTLDVPLRQCAAKDECIHPDGCWQPATLEYFGANKSRSCGLQYRCRDCERKRQREHKREKRESDPTYARIQRQKYLETHRAASRRWYHENKAKAKAQHQAWLDANRGYPQQWYTVNKWRYKKYWRNFVERDPLRARAKGHRRRARVRGAKGHHTQSDIRLIYRSQKGRCWWCGDQLGDKFHVDHRIPLAKGGSDDASNLVVSCEFCNCSKADKLPHEWNGRLL